MEIALCELPPPATVGTVCHGELGRHGQTVVRLTGFLGRSTAACIDYSTAWVNRGTSVLNKTLLGPPPHV